jgi:hypothetical protein
LGRLGLLGTVALFGGVVAAVLAKSAFGLIAGAVVLLALAVVLAPLFYRDRTGRNGWQLAIRRVAWRLGLAKGQDIYLAGLVGATLHGTQKLPGLLAGSVLHEFTTAAGQRVGMVAHPAVRHYAVSLRVHPDGSSLVNQATVDAWVAHYGCSSPIWPPSRAWSGRR